MKAYDNKAAVAVCTERRILQECKDNLARVKERANEIIVNRVRDLCEAIVTNTCNGICEANADMTDVNGDVLDGVRKWFSQQGFTTRVKRGYDSSGRYRQELVVSVPRR